MRESSLGFSMVQTIALIGLGAIGLMYLRMAWKVSRLVPKGSRARVGRVVARRLLRGPRSPHRLEFEADEDLIAHAESPEPRFVEVFDAMEEEPDLVTDLRVVVPRGTPGYSSALDLDGGIAAVYPARDSRWYDTPPEPGYMLAHVAADGSQRIIAEGGPHREGFASGVSIDRGTISWWRLTDSPTAELWVARPGEAPRMLLKHTPRKVEKDFTASGWTIAMGDRVVWSLQAGIAGDVGVTDLEGRTSIVTSDALITVHRDIAAELLGRSVVAFSIGSGVGSFQIQVCSLDLSTEPPTVTSLRRGLFMGASVVDGVAVGLRRETRTLELPGGLWVELPFQATATDVAATSEWAAFFLTRVVKGDLVWTCQLVHIPSRTRHTLAEPSWGVPHIRGDHVMWSIAPPGEHAMKVNPFLTETVVARLKSPASLSVGL